MKPPRILALAAALPLAAPGSARTPQQPAAAADTLPHPNILLSGR